MASIVLADDHADLRSVYVPVLRSRGHQVREAADGRQAVQLVRQHRPDLLILDVWMPELNGFEVLDAIRHDASATRLKVLVLSVLGDADCRFEAFGGGAMAYLVKGLPLFEFVDRVESLLAEARTTPLDPVNSAV